MASPFDFNVVMAGHNRDGKPKDLPLSNSNDPVSIDDLDRLPKFKEDYTLTLRFSVTSHSERPWKLYILGINTIAWQIDNIRPNPRYQWQDNYNRFNGQSCKFYFPVGTYTIYNAKSQSERYVAENMPITPNVYTIKVTDGKNWYYSHFVIIPKSITLRQWSDMLSEIGQLSHRMSVHHDNWQSGFMTKRDSQISLPFADQMTKFAPKIRVALHFILQGFRFDTKKHYRWVRRGREHLFDARSVQMSARFPASIGMVYAPYRYSEYNTGDNQWIKFIATRMLKWSNQALEHYGQSKILNNQQLLRLRNYLSYALNTSLLNQVNTYPPRFITKGLIYSPRYNQFFKLYQELLHENRRQLVVQPNQFRFKKTDKLYEFWVFIKIVQVLRYYGYQSIKGWGCGTDDDAWLLKPNTRVLMKKGDMYLRVVYDDDMGGINTKYDEPIMMFGTTHQRPDARIDILYKNREYWGSLILDAKYKPIGNVIMNSATNGQLTDYSAKSFDRYNNSLWVSQGNRCVIRTLAVYPGSNTQEARRPYSAQLFRLRQLGVNLERLCPDDQMNLYGFANDVHVQLESRIEAMKR